MRRIHIVLVTGLALLLAACIAAAYLTRDLRTNVAGTKPAGPANAASPVDQRLLQTADQLAAVADTREEQALARQAAQVADHELDQAFSSALREASQAPVPDTGPVKQAADRVAQWNAQLAADQARVQKLAAQAGSKAAASDQLELAKAQVALDQDELLDAQQDLARQGGDQHATLERALQEHEAAEQQVAQAAKTAAPAPIATLGDQVRMWFSLRDREQRLNLARSQAANHAATLGKAHDALEAAAAHKPAPASDASSASSGDDSSGDADQEDIPALVARLQHLSDQKKSLADLDSRIQDSQELAAVYARWISAVQTRQRSVLHLLLDSLGEVLLILLAMVSIDGVIRRTFSRKADPRRLHQMRVMLTIAVQIIAVALIVLIVFGPPSQLSTIIGLTTAGLTVALKDFIVAFFGWFALMGRNGIRIGDWVEIRGVGGEVVEIGLWKTVLLEMGDWGQTGHPTGRRVAFVNSFAVEGHYFNFSTAGQWLWDEMQIALPPGADPYRLSQQLREIVERTTAEDARDAEKDWERVTRQYGTRPFSAKPLVELRPSATGLDAMVRYITRAPQRHEVKSRLFGEIVDLLHKSSLGAVPEPTRQASSST